MAEGKTIKLRILRRQSPTEKPYWEEFVIPYQPSMNVISCLQVIATKPVTVAGKRTTPVAWECSCLEEVCGACTVVINGKPQQACSALVDALLAESNTIEIRAMSKFPIIRDLIVDRSAMFEALKKVKAWIPIDGLYAMGAGPKMAEDESAQAYLYSRCMTCGCCTEACPQYNSSSDFFGPFAVGQVDLFNSHPTGKMTSSQRLDALAGKGGISDCGNAQNCEKLCPKEIPLLRAIALGGRKTTFHALRKFFDLK